MRMVRAKFRVDKIERILSSLPKVGEDEKVQWVPGELRTVIMSPVYGGGDPKHENVKFWQASPSGHLEIGCANLAAAESFELGEEYYVDFTLARELP